MLMYWLFINKNITPGQYYAAPLGEKLIWRAFAEQYIENLKEKR